MNKNIFELNEKKRRLIARPVRQWLCFTLAVVIICGKSLFELSSEQWFLIIGMVGIGLLIGGLRLTWMKKLLLLILLGLTILPVTKILSIDYRVYIFTYLWGYSSGDFLSYLRKRVISKDINRETKEIIVRKAVENKKAERIYTWVKLWLFTFMVSIFIVPLLHKFVPRARLVENGLLFLLGISSWSLAVADGWHRYAVIRSQGGKITLYDLREWSFNTGLLIPMGLIFFLVILFPDYWWQSN